MTFITDKLADNQYNNATSSISEFQSRFIFSPEKIMTNLRKNILAQDEILSQIENILMVIKANIGDQQKPLSVNLLIGPTGVGKTEIVRLIAEGIYGDKKSLCRIDMNTLSQSHYSAAISGAPPGYVGSKEGTTLFDTDQIEGTYSLPGIVLFDEIEKADKTVLLALLNILDNGELILSSGKKKINFRNSMIFLTSNLGFRQPLQPANKSKIYHKFKTILNLRNYQKQKQALNLTIHRHFPPEFLNRIDRILMFNPITQGYLDQIAELEINKLKQRLLKYKIDVTFDNSVKNFICTNYDMTYGAREIHRYIRTILEPVISKAIITYPSKKSFSVITHKNKIICAPE